MQESFVQKYGPWGVVTGGTRGIGKALAENIASKGLNVVIVGTRNVEEVAKEISARFGVETKGIVANLADPAQIGRVVEECRDLSVGLFCCNHASSHVFPDGKFRRWLDTTGEEIDLMLQINLVSSTKLLHQFIQKMRPLKRGGVVIVTSVAGLVGTPFISCYSASKSFLSTLGAILWQELKGEGIDVVTVVPGLTKTEFGLKFLKEEGHKRLNMLLPENVAESAISNLGKRGRVIPGFQNKLEYLFLSLLPKGLRMRLLEKTIPRFFSVHNS